LQGASATESLLEKIHDPGLRVLVVWEPMLLTDWAPPTTGTLHRIHESGVDQFWDEDHLVAHEISQELAADPEGPKPSCCTSRDTLWDFAVVFPKQALWQSTPPKPVFADGPVVRAQPGLRHELAAVLTQKN
jgi:hypothetical protein